MAWPLDTPADQALMKECVARSNSDKYLGLKTLSRTDSGLAKVLVFVA